jgi:lysophospholipase L1-like esterase
MTKTILTFGDSNTYGSPPIDKDCSPRVQRYGPDTRWPGVLAARTGWNVIEQGLPGRTATDRPDPEMGAHTNGPLGLRIALNSCGPIDALVLMLGTNDQKTHFDLNAQGIAEAMANLIEIAKSDDVRAKHGAFEILLICPPAVQEGMFPKTVFKGANPKSAALPDLFASIADRCDLNYLNANTVIKTSDIDGVHFDEAGHNALGKAISNGLLTSLV